VYVQFVYKLYFQTSPFHEFQSLVTITEMILRYSGSPFSTVHFCEFTFSYLVHYWSSFSQWALLHLNCVSTTIIVPRASFLGHFFRNYGWLFHRLQCSAMDDQLLHCIRVSPKLVMHFFRVLLTLFGWSSSCWWIFVLAQQFLVNLSASWTQNSRKFTRNNQCEQHALAVTQAGSHICLLPDLCNSNVLSIS
jgi:hypothetical protein